MARTSTQFHPECVKTDAPFRTYNVGGAIRARLGSYADNNCVWQNDALTKVGKLSCLEIVELDTALGDVFYSIYPLSASGENGTAHMGFMPEYLKGPEWGATVSRGGGVTFRIYSLGATSAQIFRNGTLVTTQALTVDAITAFTQTGAYTGNWRIVANGDVLVHKRDNAGSTDSSNMQRPSTDMVGFASTAAYVASANTGGVSFTAYPNDGTNYTGTIATTYNIVNTADLATPGGTASDNYNDPRVAIRVQSADLLYANARADSDGGDDTNFLPVDGLKTHHLIEQPTEYISVLSLTDSPVEVLDACDNVIATLTPSKVNTDALAPYAVRYGLPNGGSNNPPVLLQGADPIYVVFQPKGAGLYGSDDDETVSNGFDL